MASRDASKAAPDARLRLTRRMYIFGVLFAVLALAQVGMSFAAGDGFLSASGAFYGALATLMIWRARYVRRSGRAVKSVNAAYAAMTAGRHAEAEALWAAMPEDERNIPHLRRAVDIQRTMLAMNRGELAEAITHATSAAQGKPRRQTKTIEEMQILDAISLRALAEASLGDVDRATADAATVEAASTALAAPLARASMARAVMLARTKSFEALHAHYAAEGDRLIDALSPRERALSRALRRMGRPRTRSVYREATPPDAEDASEDPTTNARGWIRRVAPEAAPFAVQAARIDPAALPAAAEAAPLADEAWKAVGARATARERRQWRRSVARRLATVGVLLATATGAFALFASVPRPHRSHGHVVLPPPSAWTMAEMTEAMLASLVAIAALYIGYIVHRARTDQARLFRALQTLAKTKDDAALADLEALAKRGTKAVQLSADRALAGLAVRDGDFAKAVVDSERALDRITSTQQMRAATQDLFAPEVMATHAYALAALDRPDEALAELAIVQRDFPNYAFASRASFRVHLMNAVRAKRYAEAARISASRPPDMPIDLRDDLLAELACAAATFGLPEKEAEALRGELHDMPDVEAWLQKVAPGLDAHLARGSVRIGDDAEAAARDRAELAAIHETAALETMDSSDAAANKQRAS